MDQEPNRAASQQAGFSPVGTSLLARRETRETGNDPRGARGMEQTIAATPKLKIGVVEDDPTIRLFLKSCLEEQLGHQVIGEAATGTDMVRTVLDLDPDIVIFDRPPPRLNRLDASRQILQE